MIVEPVVPIAAAVVLACGVPGVAFLTGWGRRGLLSATPIVFGGWAALLGAAVLLGALAPGIAILCGAMAILTGIAVTVLFHQRGADVTVTACVVALVALAATFPVILIVFGGDGLELYRRYGIIDFAGALPFAVLPGAMLIALWRTRNPRPSQTPGSRPSLAGAGLLGVAVVAAVVGFELVIDELTLVLAGTAALVVVGGGVAGGLRAVLRRRGRPVSRGIATGLVAGCAAALPAAAHLEPIPALALGLVAGLCGASLHELLARRLARALLVGGAIGMVGLGLLAVGPGFAYSGQPTLAIAQTIGLLVVAVWGLAWGGVLALILRRFAPA